MDRKEAEEFFIEKIRSREKGFIKYLRDRVYEKDEIEDLLQEGYKRMWANLLKPDFDEEEGVKPYGILKNCTYEYYRKNAKRKKIISNIVKTSNGEMNLYDKLESTEDILKSIITNFETETAYKTLLKMKRDDRMLIHLRYIECMSYKEIAEIMQMNEKTMSSKLSRAVKKFAKMYFAEEARKEAGKDEKTGRK